MTLVQITRRPPAPLFRHVATPVEYLSLYDPPETTDAGVVCGDCTKNRGEKIRHASVEHVRACWDLAREAEAQYRAETYAESFMSWVAGGGSQDDASTYANAMASGRGWHPGEAADDDDAICEHGLSAALCAGPNHYPTDM